MESQKQKIKKVFEKATKNKQIYESVLLIENAGEDFSYHIEYGGKKIDTPILMASITKLFTSTCILILREQGKLSLDDKITKYLAEDTLRGLHIYEGQDNSMNLSVSHLLCHTSGLPDAIEEGSNKARKRAIYQDMQISFDE